MRRAFVSATGSAFFSALAGFAAVLRLGRRDPAVLDQLAGQVTQDHALVRGAAAQTGALSWLGHC
jgi:hypothetical protein